MKLIIANTLAVLIFAPLIGWCVYEGLGREIERQDTILMERQLECDRGVHAAWCAL